MKLIGKILNYQPIIWLRKSISRKLNFVLLITISVFSIITGYNSYVQTKNIIVHNTEKNLSIQSESIALQVNAVFKEKGSIVKQMTTNQDIVTLLKTADKQRSVFTNPDYYSSETALSKIIKTDKQLSLVWAASEKGNFYIGNDHKISAQNFNLHDRPWYEDALHSKGVYYTDPYIDVNSGKVVVSVINKVKDGINTIGFVGIDITLDSLPDIMNTYKLGSSSYSFLLSKNGEILYHPNKQLILQKSFNFTDPIIEKMSIKMLTNFSGFERVNSTNKDEYIGYSSVPITNWSVGVSISTKEANLPIKHVAQTIVVQTIMTCLLLIFFIHIFLKFTLKQFPILLNKLNLIKDGNLNIEIESKSIDEVGQISQAIQLMLNQLKKNINNINNLAYYDQLTSLPNRRLLTEKLNTIIDAASLNSSKFAIIFLDLDNFKRINDTDGHSVGDSILKEFSNRLKDTIGSDTTIARFGGDEFVIIVHHIEYKTSILPYTKKIKQTLSKPIIINQKIYYINASVGIAYYPDHGTTVDDLLSKSDIAMYKAKEGGKNKLEYYDPSMMESILKKTKIEELLITALEQKEFILHYQPQYDSKTGEIRGFEALLRWNSPVLGFVSPDDLIPILEETGYIVQVGEWVIREACSKIKEIHSKLGLNLIVAVNISVVQLRDENFAERVQEIVNEYQIDPSLLEIEITESTFIHSFEQVSLILHQLYRFGIKIALDDFGTGYSSISYLKQLPIQILKIDRQFIKDIHINKEDRTFAAAIIRLAHELNLDVVAEGIESIAHVEYLEEWGCDFFQGYYFSKPISEDEMINLIELKRNYKALESTT